MSEHLDIIMPDLPDGWAWQPGDDDRSHKLFDVSEPSARRLVATMRLPNTGSRYMRVDELDGAVWSHPSLTDAAKWAMTKWVQR